MARHTCFICGCGYDGINCPICTLRDQARESDDCAARAREKASHELASAVADQTQRIAEEMVRTREAEAEAARQAQVLMEEAAEEHRIALAESAEQHRQNTANAWKLQAQSKCEQAQALYDSGLREESLKLALQALEQDPGNINAALLAAECQPSADQASRLLSRAIQMLSMPEYRWQRGLFSRLLSKAQTNPPLLGFCCSQVEKSVCFWTTYESIASVGEFARRLMEIGRPDLAVRSLDGLVVDPNLSLDALSCVRTILQFAVREFNGLNQCSDEIDNIIRALEFRTNIGPTKPPEISVYRALITLAYIVEFETLLGRAPKRIASFFTTLEFSDRNQFQGAALELQDAVTRGKLSTLTFSSIMETAKQKYAAWQPAIGLEILNRAKAKTTTLDIHPFPTGVIWFFALTIGEGIYAGVPRNTSSTVYLLGVAIGTVLFNTMTLWLIDSMHVYLKGRAHFASAAEEENKVLEPLGLPRVSNAQFRLRSPLIDAGVCIMLACTFFITWQKFIHKVPASSLNSVTHSNDNFASMYPWYLDGINRKMNASGYRSLADSRTRRGARVYISFSIARDGSVSQIKLSRSSGSRSWDKACLTAAQGINNFGPLPTQYSEKSLTVSYYCEY